MLLFIAFERFLWSLEIVPDWVDEEQEDSDEDFQWTMPKIVGIAAGALCIIAIVAVGIQQHLRRAELKIAKAPSTPPEILEEESDAVQGLKGKAGSIAPEADDPLAYFKPKHQVADKHKMVQCRFPECGISIKDNEVSSFCAFHRNEMIMWYDQKLWKKLEEDVNGRTIEPDEMTVAMLRPRTTSSTGQCYCRWPNCWISVNAQRAK